MKNTNLAPIVLFVYNRLWHTQQTIEALKKNELAKDSTLRIYADGAKGDKDKKQVEELRKYLPTISGFKKVEVIEAEHNKGLGESIIGGVTETVNKHGKIIVLEDDLVTSPVFLQYMNNALNFYENNDKVISVQAYAYPFEGKVPEAYFFRGADCHGWATWKRGWDLFESNPKILKDKMYELGLVDEFDFNGAMPGMKMLQSVIDGKNDSWAIRWGMTSYISGKLSLFPGKSYIKNIGLDGTGANTGVDNHYHTEISNNLIDIQNIPVVENKKIRKKFERFHHIENHGKPPASDFRKFMAKLLPEFIKKYLRKIL